MADAKDLDELAQRLEDARGFLHIDAKRDELARLDEQSAAPRFWDDAARASAVAKQASNLRDAIGEYEAAAQRL